MSVVALTWVQRLRIKGLTLANKAVLSRLADAANADWECWPSQQLIAEDLACSVRTVIRHLDKLEQLGLITRTYIQKDNGARRGTLYKLNAGVDRVVIEAPMADTGDDVVDGNLSDNLALRNLPVENSENLSDNLALRGETGDTNGGHLSDNVTPGGVENPENLSDRLAPSAVDNAESLSDNLAPALRKNPNLRLNTSSSSVLNVSHQATVDKSDDDIELGGEVEAVTVTVAASTVTLLREWHPGLDAVVLVDRLQRSGRLDLSQLDLERAVGEILQASARPVGDPVAYVAKAILAEPWRWSIGTDRPESRAGTSPQVRVVRPPTAAECGERGHVWFGGWNELCSVCGSYRPGWRDDRDGVESTAERSAG